ncbi:hypothetical protein ABZ307_43065 [Streptomyces griseorubiginosus]|uniref:hypothetical protein n=1 Tax=Streptomyces griseorubiginosus TaxID=67304 RepID=UPI0033AF2032
MRPSILAIWIIVPGLTLLVLFLHGSLSSKPAEPDVAENPCPTEGSVRTRSPSEYTTQAAPYAGRGPHTTLLIEVRSPSGMWLDDGTAEVTSTSDLPQEWQVTDDRDYRSEVQLVLCQYKSTNGASAGSCSYRGRGPGELILFRTVYSYRLYTARDAKLLTAFRLAGSGCPSSIYWYDGQSPPTYVEQEVDGAALEKVLRPFVAGSAK